MSRVRLWMVRLWRLLALLLAAWLLHLAAEKSHRPSQASASLEQAQKYFPNAIQVAPSREKDGGDAVFDENGKLIGFLISTSPQADSIIGYVGPNNVLIAMDAKGRVVGAELISSGDTHAHSKEVRAAASFWKQFVNWKPSQEPMPKIEAVAGSTLTSLGIAESIQKRVAGRAESLRFPEPVTLKEIQELFPTAERFQQHSREGWFEVKDNAGLLLGFTVRTSPMSDYTHGHAGPTDMLVAVAPDAKKLVGVRLRKSYDTDDYVDSVREDTSYLRQLTNFTVDQWATMDLKKSGLEGVSGATETSFAVAEGIRLRFAADAKQEVVSRNFWKPRDFALLGILAGSFVMTFSSLRGRRAVRIGWQLILIGVFGLWCGDLLSLALLAGWARNGIAWQTAPTLVLLVGAALLVPWTTRRQVYCHHLCPHGAAQEWLGKFKRFQVQVSPRIAKYLRYLPVVILVSAFVIGLAMPKFELAALEPFDAWALRGVVLATSLVALIGLVASLFVPMAYCHYGCPTGALLKFVRTTGSIDAFGMRDTAALAALVVGGAFVFWPTNRATAVPKHSAVELHGKAFGTTWNVKLRGSVKENEALQKQLANELERIESTLSHWRTNSATSRFNAARTTYSIEMPEELVTLVARTLEISRASDGAFDVTVAPLVQAWGFGPSGTHPNAPAVEEIARLRQFTGWEKLAVNTNEHTLQKKHPELQIDLGAILQGYAADCLAKILNESEHTEYLIDVGGEFLAKGRWRVAIEDPAHPEQLLRVLYLENSALATSGTYRAKHNDGKKRWSHLINPRTGEPVTHDTTLVSVVHRSCASADAWATALIVTGGKQAETLAVRNGLGVLVVSGGTISTAGFPEAESR